MAIPCGSTPPTCKRTSATWPRTPTSAGLFCRTAIALIPAEPGMRRPADRVSRAVVFRLPLLIDLADRRHPLFDLGESLFVGAPVAVAAPIARRFGDVGHTRAADSAH